MNRTDRIERILVEHCLEPKTLTLTLPHLNNSADAGRLSLNIKRALHEAFEAGMKANKT